MLTFMSPYTVHVRVFNVKKCTYFLNPYMFLHGQPESRTDEKNVQWPPASQ